jgi:hypothetical protein
MDYHSVCCIKGCDTLIAECMGFTLGRDFEKPFPRCMCGKCAVKMIDKWRDLDLYLKPYGHDHDRADLKKPFLS